MSDSFNVQAAVVVALNVAGVADGRIYDHAQTDAVFPYVEMGESQALADDVTGADGFDEFLTLHVWSRYRGDKEAKQICSDIRSALHARSLTVAGRTTAHAWVREIRVFDDPDGLTRHGVVSVRIQHHD